MFNNSKYTNWYFDIIAKATNRVIDGYTEKHHIVPKSLDGNNTKHNLVNLTAREHYICHHLLTKMVSGDAQRKMVYAFYCMLILENKSQTRYKASSRVYENLKKANLYLHRTYGMRNKNHSIKTKKKISESMKGRIPWNKGTKGISKGPTGMKHTEESKNKIRATLRKTRQEAAGNEY